MKQLVEKGNYFLEGSILKGNYCGFFTIRVGSIQIIESEGELISYDLLLLADPSREMIDKYLSSSEIFLAKDQKLIIGILVLKERTECSGNHECGSWRKASGKRSWNTVASTCHSIL